MHEKPKYCYQCIYFRKAKTSERGRCEKLSFNFIPLEKACDYGIKKENPDE